MKNLKHIFALCFSIICFSFLFTGNVQATNVLTDTEYNFFVKLNEARVKAGELPVAVSTNFRNAANNRAKELETDFSHFRPNGTMWYHIAYDNDIISNVSSQKLYHLSELEAKNFSTSTSLYSAWYASNNKTILLNSYFTMAGLGSAGTTSDNTWNLLLGGVYTAKSISITNPEGIVVPKNTSIDQCKLELKVKFTSPEGKTIYGYVPVSTSMVSNYKKTSAGTQTIKISYSKNLSVNYTLHVESATPVVPASFKVTPASYNSVKVSFTASSTDFSYKIYRSTKKTKNFKLIATVKPEETGTYSYIDESLTSGDTYYYKVKCTSGSSSSKYTSVKSATPKIDAPATLTLTKGKKKMALKWSAVEHATKYKVYYSTKKNSGYKLKKTVTSTSYTVTKLKAKKTYYFKVVPYCGSYAGNSIKKSAKTK